MTLHLGGQVFGRLTGNYEPDNCRWANCHLETATNNPQATEVAQP